MHEVYNYLNKIVPTVKDKNRFFENYKKILLSMAPVIPHLASECLLQIGVSGNLNWPEIKKEYLLIKSLNIVVQINGKKKDLLSTDKSLEEKEILELVRKREKVSKFLENKGIKKTIYVKDKLINLII